MNKKTKKVLVAMSGGVDSTVAALLMVKKGYDVTGVFLKCWSETKDINGQCNWVEEKMNARNACLKLKIPLITIDAEKEYKKYVVEEMFKDYKRGITPNPDVLCNEIIKFPFLIKTAKKLNADKIITGHFARKRKNKFGKYELLRAKEEMKDQSYFIYRIKQSELKKIEFPIGNYTKKEIRKIAKKEGFLNHDKKSTVGICFIGKIPMKKFLQTKIPQKKGKIKDPKGNIIGKHDGFSYYTIGQRLGPRNGLEIKKNDTDKQNIARWYVAKKDIKKNEITAAPAKHELLYKKNIEIKKFHTITKNKKEYLQKISRKPEKVKVRIRHVGELRPAKIYKEKNKIKVTLEKKIDGISKGQAIVIYKNKKVIGGGEINS